MNKKKVEIKNIYVMTPMQKGILFHWLLDKDSQAYTEQLSFTIRGRLDVKMLERSLNLLIARYDIFRTIFNYENSAEPVQIVLKERTTKIQYENITHMSDCEKDDFVQTYNELSKNKRFDLSKDVLVRIAVIQVGETEYKIIWNHHHIIMDGWCLGIVSKELFQIYLALKNEEPINLPLTAPFSMYIKWIEQQSKEASSLYWKECLEGYDNQTILPSGLKSKPLSAYKVRENQFVIDAHISKKLLQIAVNNNTTVSTLFQTMWGILLQKYNNLDDVVFGTVVSGRPPEVPSIDKMIGLFINTIPVRVRTDRRDTFTTLFQKINDYIVGSGKHQHFPLYEIQSNTLQKQSLINHIVVFENYPIDKEVASLEWEGSIGFSLSDVKIFEQTNYDFTITVLPGENLSVKFTYNCFAFDEKEVKAIENHLLRIVDTVVENPNTLIEDIELLSREEQEQLVVGFNNTVAMYPKDMTIHQLFEQQVRRNPDKIAVVYENVSCTYKELDERSNQIARILRSKGVKPDCIVAIMVERSLDMIVGMIGVLKAGGAYLPIDPGFPANRIQYMIEDSGAKILLTQTELLDRVNVSAEIIDLKNAEIYKGDSANIENWNFPTDLAYIIYTSGTTGNPKGVMIEHRNLVRLFINDRSVFDFSDQDVWTMFHSFCFDFSVWEMYGALLFGGKLIIVPTHSTRDPRLFLDLLRREQVTILNQTPTAFYNVIDEEEQVLSNQLSLRYVIFGGESLAPAKLKEWVKKYPYTKLINMYGITETTVHVTYKEITEYDILTNSNNIGVALPTLTTYIMDTNRKLLPIDVVGELYVGGAGVSRGYLNRSELTNQRFLENAYVPNEKLYKTGDLARRLKDGSLEYLGRCDHQVKIRGFRIELGDIESQLLRHENIKEAIVTVNNSAGSPYLCAYIVCQGQVTIMQLRDYLSLHLPDYMIPSHYVDLEHVPLTSNGKIDRKALPTPDKLILNNSNRLPETEIEDIFVQIWREVLGVESLGTEDNFFYLGGDSIKAIQVSSRLLKQGYRMEIKDLFETPTIKGISRHVKIAQRKISQGSVKGTVKQTPIQRWFFEQNFAYKHHWNQAVMLKKKDGFNADILQKLFSKIVEHHDALRMKYETGEDGVIQIIKSIEEIPLFSMEIYDLIDEQKNTADVILEKANQLQQSINLDNGPLLKAALFKTYEGDHLLIVIHHLVVDGVSWRILLEDFNNGYSQALQSVKIQLQDKTDSYKEWAEKLYLFANQKITNKEIEYWSAMSRMHVCPLPKDRTSSVRKVENCHTVHMSLSAEHTTALLTEVNQAYNTSIDDILLTALVLVNKRWTGEPRLLLELEGHGRQEIIENVDISRTVGWFTTKYPIVLEALDEYDLPIQIKFVKEALRKIPNKGIGYSILKYLKEENAPDRVDFQLKPEIQFNYLGQFDQDMKKDLFQLSPFPVGQSVSPYSEMTSSISINGLIEGGIFKCSFTYSMDEYDEVTIRNLIECYKAQLEAVIMHCTAKDATELTPSDLSSKGISIGDLDQIYMFVQKNAEK